MITIMQNHSSQKCYATAKIITSHIMIKITKISECSCDVQSWVICSGSCCWWNFAQSGELICIEVEKSLREQKILINPIVIIPDSSSSSVSPSTYICSYYQIAVTFVQALYTFGLTALDVSFSGYKNLNRS